MHDIDIRHQLAEWQGVFDQLRGKSKDANGGGRSPLGKESTLTVEAVAEQI